jgi:hypothetical protein
VAFGFGTVFACIYWTLTTQGEIAQVFDRAPRDSFATDISEDVRKVLPIGVHLPDVRRVLQANLFTCRQSLLAEPRKIWICQRQAYRFGKLVTLKAPTETWFLEFECDQQLASCTILRLSAEILG